MRRYYADILQEKDNQTPTPIRYTLCKKRLSRDLCNKNCDWTDEIATIIKRNISVITS